MRLLPTYEFAAKRRGEQDTLIDVLLPVVEKGLRSGSWEELLGTIENEYAAAFNREGGKEVTRLDALLALVKDTLSKIGEPQPTTAQATATALAVSILNYSIMDAADDDPEPLVMEWVTMHDDAVRASHRDADGQQQPAGTKFTVGGEKMLAPGDMSAPIEEWINCRCVLAPALATMTAAISEKSWDGSASRFTDEEWKRSCIVHVCDGMEKSCHKLPIKEPNGALSRAGVHAAAGRVGQVDAPAEKINSAKRVLRGAYRQLGEEPPESLTAGIGGGTVSQTQEEPMTETEPEINVSDFAPMQWHGVLAPEEEWSGDGRMFTKDSLSHRDLPLPLTWQKTTAEGHDGAVVVGSIDAIDKRDGKMFASGTFLSTQEADELIGMITHFGRFGVSVEADDVEMEFQESDTGMPKMVFSKSRVSAASVVPVPAFPSAWIMLGPAEEPALAASAAWEWDPQKMWTTNVANGNTIYTWGGTPITFGSGYTTDTLTFGRGPGWITNPEDTRRIHAYWTEPGQPGYIKIGWGVAGDFARCKALVGEKISENSPEDMRFINNICAQWHHDATGFWPGRAPTEAAITPEEAPAPALHLVAAAGGIVAPFEWFQNPQFQNAMPLTVTDEGRVFGHIAEWGTCHVGFDNMCVEPPPSAFNYAYFQTGSVLTDNGEVAVGHLTAGGGHAPTNLRAKEAAAYYDKTSAVVADVCAGEDEHGIWVAGWVRPGVTDEQIYTLRASAISGDWRNIAGSLELIAAHCVNSPGFPVVRVAAGVQEALIASAGPTSKPEDNVEKIADHLAEQVAAALEKRQARREQMAVLATRIRKGEN